MKNTAGFYTLEGNIVDVVGGTVFPGRITVEQGKITQIEPVETAVIGYIMPGFVDAHVHVESSMLIPTAFARLAVTHGTVATVSDPHEIGNVVGVEGVKFMIDNGKKTTFKFFFGAPSCVPATSFETSGAIIDSNDVAEMLKSDDIKYLTEVMNFPGVLSRDPEVMRKIDAAKAMNKPVDGHAPGLRGSDARAYANAGISTDHECFTIEEALDKLDSGMLIQIREGSAAKNFEALIPLMETHPEKIMLCSDDKHPDDLMVGHMNLLVKRALEKGYDLISILRSVTLNPVKHYNLPVGLLQMGDDADMIVVNSLEEFKVQKTYISGELVAESGVSFLPSIREDEINNFHALPITVEDIKLKAEGDKIRVIVVYDGQLVTGESIENTTIVDGFAVSNAEKDVLKMVVLNRYESGVKPAVAFIKGIGLTRGAFASSVAHDSHNIIAVGNSDKDIVSAINNVIESKGGISVSDNDYNAILPLPIAGIMTADEGEKVADRYQQLNHKLQEMGIGVPAPFMTLSFMALLVIPKLKLSDMGLFDGNSFSFTQLFS